MLISNGFIQLELDEFHGGRITKLGLYNRENLLFVPPVFTRLSVFLDPPVKPEDDIVGHLTQEKVSSEWINYGGDFLWVAPQAKWGWPPVAEFDSMRWEIFQNDEIVMVSPVWQGIQLRRIFDFEGPNCLKVTNIICNVGEHTMSWGLWNVSQVPLINLEVNVLSDNVLKIFDYPENVSLANLISGDYLSKSEKGFSVKGKRGLDFKIGTVASVGQITLNNGIYKLTKSFDLACKDVKYPHDCNIEIYKNDDYLEAEIVWPMTELHAREEFAVNQYFEIEEL